MTDNIEVQVTYIKVITSGLKSKGFTLHRRRRGGSKVMGVFMCPHSSAVNRAPFSTANTAIVLLNVCSVCSTERLFAANVC